MPVDAKPLFRPDVLRPHLEAFQMPARVADFQEKLDHWAELIGTGRADSFKEQVLLPDFLTDFFVRLLGYRGPAHGGHGYTISREKHVVVDGKFADAVLGNFNDDKKVLVVLEGKGPKDPLERPYAGRKKSAVDQGYGYAINLLCDWIIVTSMRETRLYYKGADQQTYERFDTEALATSEARLKRFVFPVGTRPRWRSRRVRPNFLMIDAREEIPIRLISGRSARRSTRSAAGGDGRSRSWNFSLSSPSSGS